VPKAAGTDHQGSGVGRQLVKRPAVSVIRGQRGVRERSCPDWIEAVGKTDEKIRRRQQKLVSHAAIKAESTAPAGSRDSQWVLAVDLYSAAAAGTVAKAHAPETAIGWPTSQPWTPSPKA